MKSTKLTSLDKSIPPGLNERIAKTIPAAGYFLLRSLPKKQTESGLELPEKDMELDPILGEIYAWTWSKEMAEEYESAYELSNAFFEEGKKVYFLPSYAHPLEDDFVLVPYKYIIGVQPKDSKS